MSEVAAIILAAGQGARFGAEPKLLAVFKGRPLVRHVAEAAASAAVEPLIVVTGHQAQSIEAVLAGLPIRPAFNPDYEKGLSTSLRVGFSALPPEAGAAVVLLGDMPLVTAALIDELVEAWRATGRPAALVPQAPSRPGNPVVLSRALAAEIASLEGDVGAGGLLRGRSDVRHWPIADRAVLEDVDTREALDALNRQPQR